MKMKLSSAGTYAAVIALALSNAASAQWVADPAVNVPVCVMSSSQQDQRIVTDGRGGAYIVWKDFRTDGLTADIYAQRLDAAGNPKWALNGVPVVQLPGIDENAFTLTEDGEGGAIVAWEDMRNANIDIYAQKIDSMGNMMWTANGVPVVTGIADQSGPKLIADGAGGAFIVWQDLQSGMWDIYAQRVNTSGITLWNAAGEAVCLAADNQINPRIETDGRGGAVIAWQDKRSTFDYDIYAQRIDGSGASLWASDGIAVCSVAGTQNNVKIRTDGIFGTILAWPDKRNGSDYDIYAQRLDSSGNALWSANGVAVCAAAGSQSAIDIASDNISGAILAWKDFRSGLYSHIYAQRIDLSGNMKWVSNGKLISAGTLSELNPNVIGDGAGGAILTWQDSSGTVSDVLSQRVDSSGALKWAASGVQVGTAADAQTSPKNVGDGSGGSIYVWQDFRNGADWDVYAHHLYSNGSYSGVGIAALSYAASGISVFPNPAKDYIMIEGSAGSSAVSLKNILGEEVANLVIPSGETVRLSLDGFPAGLYVLGLNNKNFIKIEKVK